VAYRGELLAHAPIDTADAQRVRLTSAHVAVEALELWACPETTLARAARLFGPSVARAHTAASPTRIGVPVVVDGLSDQALRPGTFRPTPGAYCGLRGMLATPDEDALGADPSAPLNAAVELSGERLGPSGEVLGTFSLRSTMSVSFEWTFYEPLVLDASAPYAEAWVVLDAAAWMVATTLPSGRAGRRRRQRTQPGGGGRAALRAGAPRALKLSAARGSAAARPRSSPGRAARARSEPRHPARPRRRPCTGSGRAWPRLAGAPCCSCPS
jgi:hypothetical protein